MPSRVRQLDGCTSLEGLRVKPRSTQVYVIMSRFRAVLSSPLTQIGQVEPRSQSSGRTKICRQASDKSSVAIMAPWPACMRGEMARSRVSYWQRKRSARIKSFTEWPRGHERSWMTRHFSGFERFLGTAPIDIGDPTKLRVGGERNGPAMRLRSSSRCNSLIMCSLASSPVG